MTKYGLEKTTKCHWETLNKLLYLHQWFYFYVFFIAFGHLLHTFCICKKYTYFSSHRNRLYILYNIIDLSLGRCHIEFYLMKIKLWRIEIKPLQLHALYQGPRSHVIFKTHNFKNFFFFAYWKLYNVSLLTIHWTHYFYPSLPSFPIPVKTEYCFRH